MTGSVRASAPSCRSSILVIPLEVFSLWIKNPSFGLRTKKILFGEHSWQLGNNSGLSIKDASEVCGVRQHSYCFWIRRNVFSVLWHRGPSLRYCELRCQVHYIFQIVWDNLKMVVAGSGIAGKFSVFLLSFFFGSVGFSLNFYWGLSQSTCMKVGLSCGLIKTQR